MFIIMNLPERAIVVQVIPLLSMIILYATSFYLFVLASGLRKLFFIREFKVAWGRKALRPEILLCWLT